ncbi:hypothetical protein FXB40_18810 [Bradyrhizobium rifense]|uniref:Uncharacterized protein n=1 Tax=Bradyrhizobium rifense TaxID=515499 RepID=A0A5D3KIY0_9BRAD|nr:hypothetical protein [Bradyrhizobium rifense]TYL93900.1 hypothetical protein FXB40_18810 [Bradyrhizobium rifense]
MKQHDFEAFFITAIVRMPLVAMGAVMPPRDPDEDEDDEEDDEEEDDADDPAVVREPDED